MLKNKFHMFFNIYFPVSRQWLLAQTSQLFYTALLMSQDI